LQIPARGVPPKPEIRAGIKLSPWCDAGMVNEHPMLTKSRRHPFYRVGLFKAGLNFAGRTPRGVMRFIGTAMACAGKPLAAQGRAAIRANLRVAAGLDGEELEALCGRNILNFGRMLADYFHATSAEPAQILRMISRTIGEEHLIAARERGRGVIIVTAHLGNWELGGIMLALRGHPLNVVTLEEPTSELNEWRESYRRRFGIKTVTIGSDQFSFLGTMQALRAGECVALLVDRPHHGTGLPVRFFGRETEFSSAPALLSKHTGAAVIPAFVIQEADGRYISAIHPEIEFTTEGTPRETLTENTQRVAAAFESVIGAHLDQWYNYGALWKD
jgi:lauroyl/myristoyl acyltransferase